MSNYKKTLVVSPAFYPSAYELPAGVVRMLKSAQRVGIDVELVGLGRKHVSNFQSKIVELYPIVSKMRWDYILLVDACDVVFTEGLPEFHRRFDKYNHPFVVSAEKNCYPLSTTAPLVPHQELPAKYLNSGAYLAERTAWLRGVAPLTRAPGSQTCDQGVFQAAWMSGNLDIVLDYHSTMFLNLFGFRSIPDCPTCLLHANGDVKWLLDR